MNYGVVDDSPRGLSKEFVLTFILIGGMICLYFSEAPWYCYAGVFLFYFMIIVNWFKDWEATQNTGIQHQGDKDGN